MTSRRALLLTALMLAAFATAEAKDFSERYSVSPGVPQEKTIVLDEGAPLELLRSRTFTRRAGDRPIGLSRGFEITMLIDAGSVWSGSGVGAARVFEEMSKVAAVFDQCQASVDSLYVHDVDLDPAFRATLRRGGTSPYDPPAEVALFSKMEVPVRPVMLMIQNGGTYAYSRKSVDHFTRTHPQVELLIDMTTISWEVAGDYHRRFRTQPSYTIFGHELAHLFGNFGHVSTPEPNLMNSYEGRNRDEAGRAKTGDLNGDQCAAVLRYGSHLTILETGIDTFDPDEFFH